MRKSFIQFQTICNAEVRAEDYDYDLEKMIKKFTKKVKKSGVIAEVYDRRNYIKPSQAEHNKIISARKKHKKNLKMQKVFENQELKK